MSQPPRLPWVDIYDLHPVDEDAPRRPPETLEEEAVRIAVYAAAGILVGLLLVWLLDRVIDGPGLGVMVGQ